MAVTNNYMKEEQQRINNQKASAPAYGGNYSPVSQQRKAQTPQVTQPAVQYTAGIKPQTYVSRYQPVMDSILAQIQNPDAFRYEFNGDELFKSYADLYTQRGKQAMLDTMGQAAGLTGGYGNSYAQQVGQQTYQNYLLGLYDKGFDLRNAAYGQYQDELGNLKDTLGALQAAEQADYGRYADALAAWQQQQQFEEDKRRYDQEWAHMLALEAAAAADAGGGGGPRRSTEPENGNGNNDISFKQANDILLNAKLNSPNLPASAIKAGLTGSVQDYINSLNQNLQANAPNLYNNIVNSTPQKQLENQLKKNTSSPIKATLRK